jgi:hypothetical protein
MLSTKPHGVDEAYRLYCQFEQDHAKHLENEIESMTEREKAGSAATLIQACTPVRFEYFVRSYDSMGTIERARMCEVWRGGFKKWNHQFEEFKLEHSNEIDRGASLYNPSFDYMGLVFPDNRS